MGKIRISAVKYANTYPFIYGLTESGFDKKTELSTDHPSECAAKLIDDRVDIGLIPVAAILNLKEYHIISDYCIGADGDVRTVMLLCNCPFNDIKKIFLDYRSRSSVNLVKVLAKNFWKKDFEWINTSKTFDFKNIGLDEAVVLIGDQCFEYSGSYRHAYDLATEWKKYTGLPFVFACWVANKKLPQEFIDDFNNALKLGVNNIDAVTERFGTTGVIYGDQLGKYLKVNIDFNLDEKKKIALSRFLDYIKKL